MNHKKVIVIGAGYSGLSTAGILAKSGYDVTIVEKNNFVGGRGHKRNFDGYTFDMGPSWYWMPEVFENWFALFDKKVTDYYGLKRLNPSYSVCYGQDDFLDIPADLNAFYQMCETIEKGSAKKIEKFLKEAAYKYEVAMSEFVFKPSLKLSEFIDGKILKSAFKIQLLTSISKHIRKFVSNKKLIQLLEFPVLFLGAKPENTPALYSMMNYADIVKGTWHPEGGMAAVAEAMAKVCNEQGVKILLDAEVVKISTTNKKVNTIQLKDGTEMSCDILIGAGDYHHIEQKLIEKPYRKYSEKYWAKREMAPSCILYYLGINKKLRNLNHHTLFFDTSFKTHAKEIYDTPKWPSNPQFYTSVVTQTEPSWAPEGHDAMVILIPVAPGLVDTPQIREEYLDKVLHRLETLTYQTIRDSIVVNKSFAYNDFVSTYHSFKGNAYGLANTLKQTAILKPSIKNSKITNLYYCGQLTVPGPGVPPTIISGQIVADLVKKDFPLN